MPVLASCGIFLDLESVAAEHALKIKCGEFCWRRIRADCTAGFLPV